jgi:acylphosphatase
VTDQVVERRIIVSGRVQGVVYRWFACQVARSLGVRGWVHNLPDGTVELEAAGPIELLDQLTEALRAGPPGARVDEVQVGARTTSSHLPEGFSIAR